MLLHFVLLTIEIFREYSSIVYHFQSGLALIIDYMIIFNRLWNFIPLHYDEKFPYNYIFIFGFFQLS